MHPSPIKIRRNQIFRFAQTLRVASCLPNGLQGQVLQPSEGIQSAKVHRYQVTQPVVVCLFRFLLGLQVPPLFALLIAILPGYPSLQVEGQGLPLRQVCFLEIVIGTVHQRVRLIPVGPIACLRQQQGPRGPLFGLLRFGYFI